MASHLKLILLSTHLFCTVSAWLPHLNAHRMESRDGSNFFNNSAKSIEGRWLPTNGNPIRGVNLGSLFVLEPWMASNSWSTMGCDGQQSEFDCVSHLGQDAANSAFQNHWGSWITQDDFKQMQSYGLNAVRIPLGYWLDEDIVYSDSEHFPQGAMSYLESVVGWASDAGFYIVLDLHGAPGAQVASNADTGQYASTPGFYVDYQYERGLKFLEFLVEKVHKTDAFRNVGMIEIVNEPLQNTGDETTSMRTSYYKDAWDRVHSKEDDIGVHGDAQVHLAVMNNDWGSGNPTESMNSWYVAFDDHRYLKWDSRVSVDHASYISASCNDKSQGDSPGIVGEFSLSPPDDVQWNSDWDPNSNKDFYMQWFAAQITSYEEHNLGWFFWSWKTELGDYRWSYQDAVSDGVIPENLGTIDRGSACG